MNIRSVFDRLPVLCRIAEAHTLFCYYKNQHRNENEISYLVKAFPKMKVISLKDDKTDQICSLIKKVHCSNRKEQSFFYSIDEYTVLRRNYQILDNYSIDYAWVVNSDFSKVVSGSNSNVSNIVKELRDYIKKCKRVIPDRIDNIKEIESIFFRPAEHFHEAIQRILFVNQWLWQTGHKHNGFGHLDWILYDLYQKDMDSGYISKENAKQYLKDFFNCLHDKCWFKSTMLLGDTGQIIILGGVGEDGIYRCNELTYLFIEVSKELKLPDPKVLLRVSTSMPDKLLYLAMECIATGIGAPFLSNDDIVIPALIQFGYTPKDAYNYATSACWEPLTIGNSCDQNNIQTINFCKPFVEFIDSEEFEKCENIDDVKRGYFRYLSKYINHFLSFLDEKEFEEDPLLTLFNPEVFKTGKDIVRGGAKYANLGVTSVGLSTVVNSLLNLEKFVFEGKDYSLCELNDIRRNNFENNEKLRKILDRGAGTFGEDEPRVIELTNQLLRYISVEFHKHHTRLGGKYKFGLSSPNYIVDARDISATFDGRKAGVPFSTHISGKNGLAPTELISFAAQLDYNDNRINGNVVDFIMSPGFLQNNMEKAVAMLKGGIRRGFYQLQINVVNSKTLIEAQNNPELYPNLVVRVWGFSAYFTDLPKEYQDNLIKRAIEAEMGA